MTTRSSRGRVADALRRVLPGRWTSTASPVDHESWLARQPWADGAFPQDWVLGEGGSTSSGTEIVAVVHVFYPDLFDDLIGRLRAIPVPFDLIITNASRAELSVDTRHLPEAQRIRVLRVENRGRDLWPLVQLINAGLLDRYGLIIKVHTKHSHWREGHDELVGTGASWRADLLAALLGDQANVRAILDAFRIDPGLGMVTADGSVLGPAFWGSDEPAASALLRRLALEWRPEDLAFAAGSMYWTRGRLLRRLRDLRMTSYDFQDEAGQIDGTTAHALERVIGLLAAEAGLRIAERSRLPSLAEGPA